MTLGVDDRTTVVVVSAGVSQPSSTRLLAERLAGATTAAARRGGGSVQIEMVDLRDWARDLANHVVTGVPTAGLARVLALVSDADALVAVSPIYRASYSGLFKTFFDAIDEDALVGKPVLIAATGGSVRHSLALDHALRPLFAYLGATVIPTAVYAATEDWASAGELDARVDRAARELVQQLQLPSAAKVANQPFDRPREQKPFDRLREQQPFDRLKEQEDPSEDAEVVPFSRLLAAQREAAVSQYS
jgi:FMN reductase